VQIRVSDVLPDTRPWESLSVEEGDATVTEIVRGEGRDPRGSASARDRGPETLLPEAVEDATTGDLLARGEGNAGDSEPEGRSVATLTAELASRGERLGERSTSIPGVSGTCEPLNRAVFVLRKRRRRRIRDSNPCYRRERAAS